MSTEINKWIDVVGKLLQLTQEGNLSWAPHQPSNGLNNPPDRIVDVVYQTRFKDRTLRLYELHYKYLYPRVMPPNYMLQWSDKPEFIWSKKTVLELFDPKELSTWTFPQTEILDHLLNAVRYQVTGVKDFLDEVLTEVGRT